MKKGSSWKKQNKQKLTSRFTIHHHTIWIFYIYLKLIEFSKVMKINEGDIGAYNIVHFSRQPFIYVYKCISFCNSEEERKLEIYFSS